MGCTIGRGTKDEAWDKEQAQLDAALRRTKQPILKNVVREIYDKDISEFYQIMHAKELGEGSSGKVKPCRCKTTKVMYAMKTLEKGNISEDSLKKARQEISIMAMLDHPNILRLHECFENAKRIYLVMPLCKGKELLERLNTQSGRKYDESVACKYMKTYRKFSF